MKGARHWLKNKQEKGRRLRRSPHVTLPGNARHVYGDFQEKAALSELMAEIPIGVGDRGVRRQVMALSNGICLESQWFG